MLIIVFGETFDYIGQQVSERLWFWQDNPIL
uniref:Uncharacterized protein n=1 Tax=Anguilla anguilla TaxID=7936 RepID=A0A0E9QPT4_ANGAN